MSCLLIQGSLLFAASNSKNGDSTKNIKSKVEAAAAPASAAAAASAARAQSTTISASPLQFDIPNLGSASLELESVLQLVMSGPILVETPQTLKCPVPRGYRAFGCSRNCLHRHFCKEDAEKQVHEFPIMTPEKEKKAINDLASTYLWKKITDLLKQQQKIISGFSCSLYDYCNLSGEKVKIEPSIHFGIKDDIMPHRPESPIPDAYELASSVDATQECSICDVEGAAHQHFKKK